ncbi:hypothetical protein FPV67DRAFT_904108 [Lyophyllum atratum]|nr:hypothetical protein FPV67DRAFT_904108 [Lyophyllum atratum]
MLHLLSETSIFLSLPNGCLCQMTGEPIIYSVPKAKQVNERVQREQPRTFTMGEKRPFPFADDKGEERAVKRRKSDPSIRTTAPPTSRVSAKNNSPADIPLSRARLFYSRPKLLPHTNQIARPAKIEPGKYVDPDHREQQKHARHLSKYVFPRQYGLTSPFTEANSKRHVFGFPDYMDREVEIKANGSCKTPKRLKDILPLLETMTWRHGKCGYKPLRDRVCPSKLQSTDGQRLDSSVILVCLWSLLPDMLDNFVVTSPRNASQSSLFSSPRRR